jgi:uncharacterized protein YdeI (YjbR/CyaY-like superfamily)
VTIDVGPEEIRFRDAGAFDEWLAVNHGRHEGIWLKMAKKGSGIASITPDEAVDVVDAAIADGSWAASY